MEIKFIPGTGNAYSCDREGNIYSHYLPGTHQLSKEPVKKLIPYTGANNEYLMIGLSLDGQRKNCLIHRLIALTWINNPNKYPEVDHIDNNVQNNCVNNLQWVSRQMNLNRQQVDKGELNGLRTCTELYKDGGEFLGRFASLTQASEYASTHYGCSKSSLMKYYRSKGYYVVLDKNDKRQQVSQKIKMSWDLYSPEGIFIGCFKSKREAGRYIKNNIRDISVKLFSDTGKAYGYYVIEKSVETK